MIFSVIPISDWILQVLYSYASNVGNYKEKKVETDATSSTQPGVQWKFRRSIIHLECESTNQQKGGDRPLKCHLHSFSKEQW